MNNYSDLTDSELLVLINNDDGLAFAHLYHQYWERLFYIAVKKLESEQEAQEAVQDIFVKLWSNRYQLKVNGNFENYLVKAVHYQIINRKQKAIRRAMIEKNILDNENREAKSALLPDLNMEYFEELQSKLDTAILSLPSKCQLVFKMSRDAGNTNKSIARELGISEKTVEKHITHALKVLKDKLGPSTLIFLIGHHWLK